MWILVVLSLVSAGSRAQTPVRSAGLAGAWEGQLLLGSNWRFMEASFEITDSQQNARVDLPQERREFRDFTITGDQLQWTLLRGQDGIRFEGTRTGDVIRGSAVQNGLVGEFQLVRVDHTGAGRELELAGTYQTAQGDLLTIARYDFGDGVVRLALMDMREGYWGTLLPSGGNQYVFAPARSGRFPATVRAEFSRTANGVTLGLNAAPERTGIVAGRLGLYDTHEISFTNGDVTLAGELVRPRSPGPHAAVVMVHSSGNQSRNGPVAYFRLIANLLAANGITSLVYDKRGVGKSTGNWRTATFEDLAADVRAAIAAVRQTPDVDPKRVGLWGLSQAGWVAPLAAQDTDIAFLALVGAAAISPAQQEIDRVAMVMEADGASGRDIESAGRYLRLFFDVVAGRERWEKLQTAMADMAGASWQKYVPRPQAEREVGWTPAPATLDPAPILSTLRAPVLALHGANDVDVRASLNSSLFSKLSKHPDSRQRVFERADHFILEGVDDADGHYRHLSPGYLQMTIDWVKQAASR
jgi:pimeloyl-ACP methyl ester carboxylesterase